MAAGDLTIFNAGWEEALENWIGTDDIKIAILDNTTAPTAATATPGLATFTEVGTAGSYTAGGTSLGTWANFISFSTNVTTLDSATDPSWTQDASNDTDAYWGLIYNDTQAGDPALAYLDLGGPVDMSAGSLTITWNASGIITITN